MHWISFLGPNAHAKTKFGLTEEEATSWTKMTEFYAYYKSLLINPHAHNLYMCRSVESFLFFILYLTCFSHAYILNFVPIQYMCSIKKK
jgi:hypothetical protein